MAMIKTLEKKLHITMHQCCYCQKNFQREKSLAVHVCEPKRRHQEKNEPGVQIGFNAYHRFYVITQGSARLKNFDDFVASSYYKAFVKFGRYCVSIKAINIPQFVDFLVNNSKKIDHWCKDSIYCEYLTSYLKKENINDALTRAFEQAMTWSEQTGNPSQDYLRYGNNNAVCYAISTGRISAWVIYNCESGQKFLDNLNQEQLSIIWPMIDPDFWTRKFTDYPADREFVKSMLINAGW